MSEKRMTGEQLRYNLAHFTSSEQIYGVGFVNPWMKYTEGVRFFFENAGAFWLGDILATQPEILATMRTGMAVATLTVGSGTKAKLVVTNGNDDVQYTRNFDYTDCPEGEWRFYIMNNTILLTSEY